MADTGALNLRATAMGLTPGLVSELDMVSDWGLLATSADLTITGCNRWLERRSNQRAETFLGRPLFDVFPSLLTRKFDTYFRQALGGQTVILSQRLHKYLLPLPSPSAEPRFDFMQQTSRIIPVVHRGSVCGTVSLVEDVTERVAYEAELRERVEALREADRRKDEFLAMLAHELRNPLAPIANAVHVLTMSRLSDPILVGMRDMIGRQVSHLSRLVDDLLDVSRITRGKVQLHMVPLELAAVARQAIETCRPLLDSRRHRLTVALPPDPVRVEGDFVRLSQVVSNLLNNAAKYTDEGGEVALTAAIEQTGAAAAEAVIRVRDNGRGIDPAALGSLFELFYQVDRTLDRSDGGLGIGLALVKSLTEMHGGRVEAFSAGRGKGSEFSLHLPLLKEKVVAAPVDSGHQPVAAPPTRILVVDDNQDSADSMALLLELDGHDVWTAYDGNTAVKVAERERPAVILLDIGLPGLNGYDTCKAIREAGLTDAFVVAMTGYGQEEDRRLSRQAGFDAHRIKPLDYTDLKKLLAARAAPG